MGLLTRLASWLRPASPAANLREQEEALALRNRVTQLEVEKRVLESWYGDGGWVGDYMNSLMRNYPDRVPVGTISTIQDRRAGRNFPLYLNETDLNVYRAPARILCRTNNYAMGLVGGLTAYVVNKGFTYRWQTKGIVRGTRRAREDAKNPLVHKMQDIWDEFYERELFGELETELYWRDREDGESFLWHGIHPTTGRAWVRTVEPEQIYLPTTVSLDILNEYKVPQMKAVDAWTFGILTDPDDAQTRHGYAVHDLLQPALFDFVVSYCMVQAKTWPRLRSVKRGMTDFAFDTLDALRMAQKLRQNLGVGAAVQAAMAGIRQHSEASAAQVTAFQQGQAAFTRPNRTGANGGVTNYANLQPGSIIDMDGQSTFVPPPSGANAMPHIEILAACLRGAGAKYNAPEWLASGGQHDSASFASSLTEESPFVKTRMMEQFYYVTRRRRTAHLVRQFAIEQGLIDYEALATLEVAIEPPHVQVRNKEEQARVDAIYQQMGAKSIQQIDLEQGWDYEEQAENIKEHAKNNPAAQQPPQPGGQQGPGADGQPKLDLPDRAGSEPSRVQHESFSPVAERLEYLRRTYGDEAAQRIVATAAGMIRGNGTVSTLREDKEQKRGQPDNAGQFASQSGGGKKASKKADKKDKNQEKKPKGEEGAGEVDPAANRPSKPEERHKGATPKALPWKAPPPKKPRAAGVALRPTGDEAQGKLGDHTEKLAQQLGFRNILPEGQRSHKPGEVATKGSTIDVEYDHSGRAYEIKMCKTTSTEYRLKAKASEKEAKLKYAKLNKLEPFTMIAVRDADTSEVHFYAAKRPGMIGAEVSEKDYDFVGTIKF